MFIFFGEFVISVIYGNDYLPAAEPLKIVTWYTAFSYLGVAKNAWIICENKQRYLKYTNCMSAVVNIVLNLIMIPYWGISGAAFASLITQIITNLIFPYFFKDMRPNVKLMVQALLLIGIK